LEKNSRVEKYQNYRDEISKMSLETPERQQKLQVRDKLSKKITNAKSGPDSSISGSNISYKELLAGAESNINTSAMSPYEAIARKRKIQRIILLIFTIITILILLFTGIYIFGGFSK
jgi:hypothetical protein